MPIHSFGIGIVRKYSYEYLPEGTYYAVITLVDEVGLETVYYAEIVLGPDCDIDVTEGLPIGPLTCVDWVSGTTDTIGECGSDCFRQD